MDSGAVGIELPAVEKIRIVLVHRRLGDQVHHVKAESLQPLLSPEIDDVSALFPHIRVRPVQVRLGGIKQMQIPLIKLRNILPGWSSELGLPVGGRKLPLYAGFTPAGITRAGITRGACCEFPFAEDVVLLILFLAPERSLEPLVLRGGVIEHHVKHEADAALFRFPDQILQIFHGPVSGVDPAVVRHIIAVVLLRGDRHRVEPDDIDPQLLKIIQAGNDAADITPSVSFGILKRFRIDLIYYLVLKSHAVSFLPCCPSGCTYLSQLQKFLLARRDSASLQKLHRSLIRKDNGSHYRLALFADVLKIHFCQKVALLHNVALLHLR